MAFLKTKWFVLQQQFFRAIMNENITINAKIKYTK
jgi:hypothetical protein